MSQILVPPPLTPTSGADAPKSKFLSLGLHKTYPNVVNFEAVRSNEYNKFSQTVPTPGHNVDIAFARMIAGPLDYTPGVGGSVKTA
jgi:hypothetical protein